MARKSGLSDSSLELLLDTICNTFGGVLFLAMLVSLLLTQTRKRAAEESAEADPRPAMSAADLVRMGSHAEDLEREISQLQAGIDVIQNMATKLTKPGAEENLAAMREAERRAADFSTRRVRLLADIADTQAATARAARETVGTERDRQALQGREQEALERLEAARRARDKLVSSAIQLRDSLTEASTVSTTGRAPRERETNKDEFGVMLKYGRMYLMHVFDTSGRRVNTADFVITHDDEHDTAEPKPHKGLDLTARRIATGDVRRLLADHPPESWYPCLIVHPDSFEEFLKLKAVLVSLGYEYRLMPTHTGVFDGGGDGGKVQ